MKYFFTLLLTLSLHAVYAQYDTIYMAVLPVQYSSPKGKVYAESVKVHIIETLSLDYRLVLVERDDFDAVAIEREYQKSEDFIDGRIVEQGKAIGAQYLMEGYYDYKKNELSFSIYDVSNGSLKCSIIADKARTENETGLIKTLYVLGEVLKASGSTSTINSGSGPKPSPFVIQTNIKQLIKECFPNKGWAVLRPTAQSGSKVKEILIAAGSRMGLKKGTIIEVQVLVSEEVGGVKRERIESAGWGRVIKVESENFSILKIEAGAKNIKKHLDAGRKLKCKYVKK